MATTRKKTISAKLRPPSKKSSKSLGKKPTVSRATKECKTWFDEQYESLTGEMWDAIVNGEDK